MSPTAVFPTTTRGRWLLAAALAMLCLPATGRAQLKHSDLQKLIREAVRNGEVTVEEAQFQVEDGSFLYHLGGGMCVLDPSLAEWDPMEMVVDAQLQVEVLRQTRTDPRQKKFWDPVLQRVEAVIAQQLEVVQNDRLGADERGNRVANRRQRIEKIYEDAMASFARSQGLRLGMTALFRPPHTVKLMTTPTGGRIFLAHTIQVRLAQLKKIEPKWRLIEDPSAVQLEGKYHYRIQWGDRTVKSEQPFLVDRDGTFVLR